MRRKLNATDILDALKALQAEGLDEASSSEIYARVGGSYATVGRLLDRLVQENTLVRKGKARATRYFLGSGNLEISEAVHATDRVTATVSPGWSAQARAVLDNLNRPLGVRQPVTYQRRFVDDYAPNESFLLPRELAKTLAQEGRMAGQQPAGTYVRKVLEQLLIDLSWSSSRLEGNTYSLLATEELFKSGAPPSDLEGVMLLNHKRAIEFLVDAVPSDGLTDSVIRNLHALLMQDLLADSAGLGAIRTKVVNISDTTYIPSQVPQLLEEMISLIIGKAQHIKNPVEAAFFLWVNLAYLQPFEDGNKRTSRLAANIPLMLYNSAPLAFLDIDPRDYAKAMLGVYELLDVTIAVELFAWTYRRSIRKYQVILEAMGSPDAFRVRHRENLSEAVQLIVREGQLLQQVTSDIGVQAEEVDAFRAMLEAELSVLTPYNCARYRIALREAQAWIERGRPR
ncbi:MAG: Fic family protein [Thiobacillus sp.]|nr:Fic family protein [Thiobacillus sp.]MDP2979167.1 Fic family protein [Thiobacillus sp.]